MESNEELMAQQRAAERAEAAPWVDYPPTPTWYPPAVGIWAAALTGAMSELDGAAKAIAVVLLLAIEGGFLGWYRSYRGTMPSGRPPVEMRSTAILFAVALIVLVALVVSLANLAPTWVPVAVALVLTTALVWWYERAYAVAARVTRDRLA